MEDCIKAVKKWKLVYFSKSLVELIYESCYSFKLTAKELDTITCGIRDKVMNEVY